MQQKNIRDLLQNSRKMVRELEILQIEKDSEKLNLKNWQALIEIENNPKIVVTITSNCCRRIILEKAIPKLTAVKKI